MGKRASMDFGGPSVMRKRPKVSHDIPTGEDVSTGDELRSLLTFDQDMRRARHGLQSLKRVLSGIVANDDDRNTKLTILRQYLGLVKPRATGEDAVFLNDIMEMWSFAVQVNDDGVMSAVAVVLDLMLRIASDSLDLVKHGLGICQTLVQERQLKSISRNLSSEKAKGFIISPTLRLLREAVCLDGGAYARRIVRAKAFTFAALARNLEIGHLPVDGQTDSKKSSVRTNAVRFFLSCLKYLHSDGRKELLSQKELLSHLTFMMKSDPPHLIIEILDTLKTHILSDSKIPREMKFKSFNTKTLMRFLALYSYANPTEAEDGSKEGEVSDRAHQFLLYACTTPGAGVLYPSTGLYPKESGEESSEPSLRRGNQGNDGLDDGDRQRSEVPVFNFVLSEFAAKLRPWSSLKHSQLLVAIFKAAPELIADYFFNNRSFTFEPKLSMTWIGYAAFLFDVMRIPLPDCFGDKSQYTNHPPPTSIVLDNVLPLPVGQKVLIRCLSPKSHLTSFFATRILVEALEKLSRALRMHQEGFRASDTRWMEASRRLMDAFCRRIPDMKEIVRCYKEIPAENGIQKAMASRLLRLYYEVIPQVALAANFDVSPFFVHVLQSLHQKDLDEQSKSLGIIELENLVSIASYSPGMRWFSKIDMAGSQRSASPFTTLLRLSYSTDQASSLVQLREVLADVAVENQFVSEGLRLQPLLQAVQVLMDEASSTDVDGIWAFLDNCVTRCATSPIKYLDLLEAHLRTDEKGQDTSRDTGDLNLLAVAMVEQLPFFTDSAEKKAKKAMAKFLCVYLTAQSSPKARDAVSCLHHKMQEHLSSHSIKLKELGEKEKKKKDKKDKKDKKKEKKDKKDKKAGALDGDEDAQMHDAEDGGTQEGNEDDGTKSKLEETLHVAFSPDKAEEDTAVLVRWHTKNVEDLVEDEWAAKLMRLLASSHLNIRKEALTNILKMAAKMKESSYEEREQVWLLLSELAESSKSLVDSGPVPSALIAFALHALDVLRNPLHPLYPKINSFLTRSPVWALDKLPLAHDILHGEPSEDDKYYAELTWFLAYVLDALQTPADLDVLHRKRWFEKVLALGSNPYLRSNLRLRILRIVYRATRIEGGSTTLTTRFGLIGWLDAQGAARGLGEEGEMMHRALMRRVWETCDQARVVAWSKGSIGRVVECI